MLSLRVSCLLLVVLFVPTFANSNAGDSAPLGSERWNEAFRAKNPELLEGILSDDFHFASAGGKCSTSRGCVDAFVALVVKRPDLTWENHPTDVQVNHEWKVAYEYGNWLETWSEPDGIAEIRGRYFAMYKQKDGIWILHAMISTPLSCIGETQYCRPKA